jgi:hypothetical protein
MIRRTTALVLAGCLLATVSPRGEEEGDDLEQIPNCGAVNGDTQIWQGRQYEKEIAGYAQTTRNWDGCFSRVRVEAWIDGTPNSTLHVEESNVGGSFAGFQWVSVPVPSYGVWNAQGKHFLVNFGYRMMSGYSHDDAELRERTAQDPPPDDPPPDDPPEDDCSALGTCEDWSDPGSPVIIDWNRDGFSLTSAEAGVLFDIDADGQLDRVAWTEADSDDTWVALDRNGNGRVDDGSELFGNRTPVFASGPPVTATNGFVALDLLQSPDFGRNIADKVLDRRDEVFSRLLLWKDSNHNGISEPNELRRADAAGLLLLGVDYKESRHRDPSGNEFRQRAKAEWLEEGRIVNGYAYDVWLRVIR